MKTASKSLYKYVSWGVLSKVQQSSIGIYGIKMVSNITFRGSKDQNKKHRYGYKLTKCPDSGNWTNNESGASKVFSCRNIRCRVLQGSPTLNDSAMIFLKLWQFVCLICRKPDAMKITSCTAAKAQALVWTKDTKHTTSSQEARRTWSETRSLSPPARPSLLSQSKSHIKQRMSSKRLILNAQASMTISDKK